VINDDETIEPKIDEADVSAKPKNDSPAGPKMIGNNKEELDGGEGIPRDAAAVAWRAKVRAPLAKLPARSEGR
jgi:hypothetical protein